MADQELIKKKQFKNRNVETYYRRLTKNIREKPIEGSYENRCFYRKQTRTNPGLKRQVQEAMLRDEKEVQEISKSGSQLEDRLEEFLQGRKELEAMIEKLRITEKEKSKTEKKELEKIKLRKRIQEELKTEEARVNMRADLEKKTREEEKKDAKPEIKMKLPKLEIIKFKGNHLDWSQFEKGIDRSSL